MRNTRPCCDWKSLQPCVSWRQMPTPDFTFPFPANPGPRKTPMNKDARQLLAPCSADNAQGRRPLRDESHPRLELRATGRLRATAVAQSEIRVDLSSCHHLLPLFWPQRLHRSKITSCSLAVSFVVSNVRAAAPSR